MLSSACTEAQKSSISASDTSDLIGPETKKYSKVRVTMHAKLRKVLRYINKHTRQKSLKKYLKSWRSRLARLNDMFDTYIKENYKVVDYQIKAPSTREHDLTWRPYGYYKRRNIAPFFPVKPLQMSFNFISVQTGTLFVSF